MTANGPSDDPRFGAAVDLIRRTGAAGFELRYSEHEHEDSDNGPTVWIAISTHHVNKAGRPVPHDRPGTLRHETAAALDPVRAVLRLAEQLVDGGACTHCHRPTGLEPDSIDRMPADDLVCWYQFDPELRTFRRACE